MFENNLVFSIMCIGLELVLSRSLENVDEKIQIV